MKGRESATKNKAMTETTQYQYVITINVNGLNQDIGRMCQDLNSSGLLCIRNMFNQKQKLSLPKNRNSKPKTQRMEMNTLQQELELKYICPLFSQ